MNTFDIVDAVVEKAAKRMEGKINLKGDSLKIYVAALLFTEYSKRIGFNPESAATIIMSVAIKCGELPEELTP